MEKKPCIFCESKDSTLVSGRAPDLPEIEGHDFGPQYSGHVQCDMCHANGPHYDGAPTLATAEEWAVNGWNKADRKIGLIHRLMRFLFG